MTDYLEKFHETTEDADGDPEDQEAVKRGFRIGAIDSVLSMMQGEVVDCNKANGWYDKDRTFGEGVALIHSEVSEMLEAYRRWGIEDVTGRFSLGDENIMPKPEGIGSEAADVLIRLLDECARQNIDLGFEYRRKMEYNQSRGYRHGNKIL